MIARFGFFLLISAMLTTVAAQTFSFSENQASRDDNINKTIVCESENYRYRFCPIAITGPVHLQKKLAGPRCIEGRSWGYTQEGVWVDSGCSGLFVVND